MTAADTAPAVISAVDQPRPRERNTAFVAYIEKICKHPGDRAALRKGLGKPVGKAGQMQRLLAGRVRPTGSATTRDAFERAHYAIASLIASTPRPRESTPEDETAEEQLAAETSNTPTSHASDRKPRTLGRCLADAVGAGTIRESSAEQRLNLLTRQSTEGLHRHLPSVVRQLGPKPGAVDWVQLLADLLRWPYDRDEVTRSWLRDFYQARFDATLTPAKAAAEIEDTDSLENVATP